MKVKMVSWNVRGLNEISKRRLIRSLMKNWKADVYCFQERKLEKEIEVAARQLWAWI